MSDTTLGDLDHAESRSSGRRLFGALTVLVIALACVATITYLYVAFRRLGYRYELEWIEGGSLGEVRRVLHGHGLYTKPTIAWTPNIYPPLYYWVSAAASKVFGLGFPTLRAVSVVSSLVLGASVALLVRRETKEWVGPIVAVGLVFAMYRIGGAWYDVARVDTLFLALLFAGLLLARNAKDVRFAIAAGVVLVLAILSKQTALIPALSVVPWVVVHGRKVVIAFVASFAGTAAILLGGLQLASGGWFSYYMWTVPSHHPIENSAYIGFWRDDLLKHLWPALVIVAGVFVVMFADRARRRLAWFYVPVFGAIVFATYSSRLHTGGWDNVLLPAFVAIALLAGIGVGWARAARLDARYAIALLLVVAQFVILRYAPGDQIPKASASAPGDRLIAALRELRGPVLMTGESWMLVRAGLAEQQTAHASALQDVTRTKPLVHDGRALERELEDAIRTHRYCTLVVTSPEVFSALPSDFTQYYRKTG